MSNGRSTSSKQAKKARKKQRKQAQAAATAAPSAPGEADIQADLHQRIKRLEAENAVLRSSMQDGSTAPDMSVSQVAGQQESSKAQATRSKGKGKGKDETNGASDEAAPAHVQDMSAWEGYGLDDLLVDSIAQQRFKQPTPIQHECLPAAILGNADVIGAAQTVRAGARFHSSQ